jgi:hypothetical protein
VGPGSFDLPAVYYEDVVGALLAETVDAVADGGTLVVGREPMTESASSVG